jgi:hypothetical protein
VIPPQIAGISTRAPVGAGSGRCLALQCAFSGIAGVQIR